MTKRFPLRILLADDHVILRQGLASLLNMESDMRVVAQAGTGRSAVDLYRVHRPNIGLIDIQMPDGAGPETISAIRAFDPVANLIVLSTYIGEEDVFRTMSAGARGYLLKDAEPDALMSCIRKVAAGGKHITSDVAAKLSDRMAGEQLSDRETDVLRQLAQGMPNSEIARSLEVSESTVKFHMNNILSKLHVSDRTQAVVTAARRGLLRALSDQNYGRFEHPS